MRAREKANVTVQLCMEIVPAGTQTELPLDDVDAFLEDMSEQALTEFAHAFGERSVYVSGYKVSVCSGYVCKK